ncbi:Hypothetical_protein [Hexamita inflata]|uniref:Hypothetical_protein n=1 Tax=Hexamita inflata TaxID=28002 RepID=A0AA86QKR0_9EUKA|nr:Hypothetical protein HINF_LOCUS41155 [Hexamita inflata]
MSFRRQQKERHVPPTRDEVTPCMLTMLSCKIAGKTCAKRIEIQSSIDHSQRIITSQLKPTSTVWNYKESHNKLIVRYRWQHDISVNCIEHTHSILPRSTPFTPCTVTQQIPVILELKQRFACVNFADDTIVELKPLGHSSGPLDNPLVNMGMVLNTMKQKIEQQYLSQPSWALTLQNRHDTRTHISSDILIVHQVTTTSNKCWRGHSHECHGPFSSNVYAIKCHGHQN